MVNRRPPDSPPWSSPSPAWLTYAYLTLSSNHMSRCSVSARQDNVAEALLRAIGEAVRADGASALSQRDVARRAGVSHAAPAHFFKNKAGMLSAFAAQGFQRLAEAVVGELDRSMPADGAQALAAVGRAYVRFAVSEPA